MTQLKSHVRQFLLCIAVMTSAGVSCADDNGDHEKFRLRTFEVQLTNLTRGQPIARVMVASHGAGMLLLDTSNIELANLAEAGNGLPMADKLREIPGITSVVVADSINPVGGGSTILITAKKDDHFSLDAMLGNSNNAFVGLGYAIVKRQTLSKLFCTSF